MLVSCEVPWDAHEQFSEELFRQEVRHFLSLGLDRLYIFGTAGEGYAVDTERFVRVANAFFEETEGKGREPQVGLIGLSTAQVLERLKLAYGIGFRMFQISLPSWGAVNDTELLRFFDDVCGRHPECRFLHYNLPRSKRVLTGADYCRVLERTPNLVATKNTSPGVDHAIDLMLHSPELQHFFGEWTFPTACLWGECSLLSSWAPLFPSRTKEIFALAQSGQTAEFFRKHQEYLAAALDVLGPMRRRALMDGAYDKAIARLGGFEMPMRLLSPYEALPEAVYDECRAILHEKYSDWLGFKGLD